MISQRTQTLVLTSVPRGWTIDGDAVRIGVHISPRLSFSGSGATIADFPAWIDWPAQKLAWEISWNRGKTWVSPSDVLTDADSQCWRNLLRPVVPVRSFTGAAPTIGKVRGYSYDTVARTAIAALGGATIGATEAGKAARTAARVASPEPSRVATREALGELTAMRGFYRARPQQKVVRGALDPDFHERLSLMSDHGPLLERLGLVLELIAAPPSSATSVMVRATWKPGGGPSSVVRSTRTACTYSPGERTFLAARTPGTTAGSSPGPLDAGLRFRLDDTSVYSVHSLDADGAAAQLMGVAAGLAGTDAAPPAGRSAGLTLAQQGRAQSLNLQLARSSQIAASIVAGEVPLLYAEDLAVGAHVQISPAAPRRRWFGIGHRSVTYRAEGSSPVEFAATDEAAVTLAARREAPGSPNLLVSDVVTRFDGWSVAAPRPGRALLQTDEGNTLDAEPERAALTWLTMDAVVPVVAADGSDGRLPALRYGRAYAMRARPVDVTGRGMGEWDGAPSTADTPYFRWDPVAAPLVLPPPTLTGGETARTLVVRSDPFSGLGPQTPAVRTLVPPRVAVEIGLLHGVFDAPGTHAPDRDAWERIGSLDDAAPPTTGPAPTQNRAASAPATTSTGPDPSLSATPVPIETTSPTRVPTTTTPSPTTASPSTSTAPSPTITSPAPTTSAPTPSPSASPSSTPSSTPSATPTTAPAPDAVPVPLPVGWLPDPMTSRITVATDGLPSATASFLPPGSSPTGFEEIGRWNSVALRLRGAVSGSSVDPVVATSTQQIVTVALAPAEVRTVLVRAAPPVDLLATHGVVDQLPGSPAAKAAAVAAGGVPVLTPSIEVRLVHAVRAPLAPPVIDTVDFSRTIGQKDPAVTAGLRYQRSSTGHLTLRASWEQWRDDGPGTPAPSRVVVQRQVVLDETLDPEAGSGYLADLDATRTVTLPDLRRVDLSLQAVATSRFVEEWREPLPQTTAAVRADGATYLVLPSDVDVESVLLEVDGRAVRRGVDVETALDPSTGQVTLRLLSDLVKQAGRRLAVRGVRGTVLQVSAPTALSVRSAVRPAPPVPRYAVPSFTIVPGRASGSSATAARQDVGLRLWLERPWWSSGDGERLAVITEVVGTALDATDTARINRLVTTFGADPAVRAGAAVPRTGALTSGEAVTRLVLAEELGSAVSKSTYLNGRLHDVAFDEQRDAYWVDLGFDDVPAGTFVRLAIARYQPRTAAAPGGNLADAVTLSRIVTLDPIQLLPVREVRAERAGDTVVADVRGGVHRGTAEDTRPFVRVSVQEKSGGGVDTGWRTVTTSYGIAGDDGYPAVSVTVPSGLRTGRVLVEEFERWRTATASGTVQPAVLPEKLPLDPTTLGEAGADLTGLRPTWIATMPLPG